MNNFNPQSSNVNEESNETTAEIPTQVPAQVPSQAVLQIHALHDKHRNLNPELVNEKKNGEEMAENYAKVKILQKGGWSFQNPPMKEIHTIKKALTKRQQESTYKHQQKRVDELTQLLLNRGVSPQQSEVSLLTQLLKNDGSLYFSQKADFVKHLYQHYNGGFVTGEQLKQTTLNH